MRPLAARKNTGEKPGAKNANNQHVTEQKCLHAVLMQ